MFLFRRRIKKADAEEPQRQLQQSDKDLIAAAHACRGFDARDELEAAIKHTREPRFGRTKRYITPLSYQFKDEIRRLFPIDIKFFNSADSVQRRVYFWASIMRLISVSMFLIFLGQVIDAFFFMYSPGHAVPLFAALADLKQGRAEGLVIFTAMWGIIWSVLRAIGPRLLILRLTVGTIVKLFSAEADKLYEVIDKHITDGFADLDSLGDPEPDQSYKSPLRAKLKTFVGSWSAKRAEYVDRYSTLCFWKIRWFVGLAERIAMTVKTGAAVAVIWYIWSKFGAHGAAITPVWLEKYVAPQIGLAPSSVLTQVSILIVVTELIGFYWWTRLPNDYWTSVLIGEVGDVMLGEKHYFHRFAKAVEEFSRKSMIARRVRETGTPETPKDTE